MSKYIDGNNPVDIAKIEENYNKRTKEAEEKAKKIAEETLESIRHYKSMSYEELVAELEAEEAKICQKEKEKYLADPNNEDGKEIIRWYINEHLKDEERKGKSFEKIEALIEEKSKALTEEEKKKIVFDRIDSRSKDWLEWKKGNTLRNDILFDLLTEEQVEKYVSLTYAVWLKRYLIDAKTEAIKESKEDLDKNSFIYETKRAYKGSTYTDSRLSEVYKDAISNVTEIQTVENMSEIQESKSQRIKDTLANALYGVPNVILAGAGGGIAHLVSSYLTHGNPSIDTPVTITAVAFTLAVTLAASGANELREIFTRPKVIEEAKKLGIYDMIIESEKSEKEQDKYIENLETIYGVDEKVDAIEKAKGGLAL